MRLGRERSRDELRDEIQRSPSCALEKILEVKEEGDQTSNPSWRSSKSKSGVASATRVPLSV